MPDLVAYWRYYMTSKRAEKKKYFTQKILAAAHELFIEAGYKNTTIEAIAERAGVGRGTAYLYFKSKSELYRITMEETLQLKKLLIQLSVNNYKGTLIETLHYFLELYIDAVYSLNKEMMNEIILSSFDEITDTTSFVYKFYDGYDTLLKAQIVDITDCFKLKNELKKSFDSEIFSQLFLKIFIEILVLYIVSDNYPKETASEHANKQMTFMVSPYLL